MATSSIGFGVDTTPLSVPPGCGCCTAAPCTICTSSATTGGTVGPTWSATVTGYTDQFLTRLTSKEQAVIDLAGGTPVHNNIDGVTFTSGGGGGTILRGWDLGFRTIGWLAGGTLTTAEELAISQFWDEMAVTVGSGGPCALATWADYNAGGYNFGGSVIEQAVLSVTCPENATYDTSGASLPIQITYQAQIAFSRFQSSSTDRISVSRNLLIGTYLEVPRSSIACPVNFSTSLNTNSLCTTCQQDRRVVVDTYIGFLGTVTNTCYDVGFGLNIPFGGTLLLVD